MQHKHIIPLALTLNLLILVGSLILMGELGRATSADQALGGSTHYVAPTGADSGDCTSPITPCRTVQYALDQAGDGDEIYVATGIYTGVQARPAPPSYNNAPASGLITQVVYLSRTVTLQGGYSPDFSSWDPDLYPTTLDAEGLGRALVIGDDISPTVTGFSITGGDAEGLKGYWSSYSYDVGGGIYVGSAPATISDNRIYSNTADWGGGIYLNGSDGAVLSGNAVYSNVVSHDGAGILLHSTDDATVSDNAVTGNKAGSYTSAIYVHYGASTLSGNTVADNHCNGIGLESGSTVTGNLVSGNDRCGIRAYQCSPIISSNTISGNTAGGLCLSSCTATVKDNLISGNASGWGGGLNIYGDQHSVLEGNTVVGNSAAYSGGGLYMKDSNQPILRNNTFSGNFSAGDGGGLYLYTSSYGVVQGNMISNNTADLRGGGVYMWHDTSLNVSNNTIISNTANRGGGIWVGKFGTLENNLIANNTSDCSGGGVLLSENYPHLIGNHISGNHAGCDGGGIYLSAISSWSNLRGNTVIGNQADGSGGGIYLHTSSPMLDNNLIAENQAHNFGAGLYFKGCTLVLRHNTIARNGGGDGSGVYVTEYRGTYTYSSTVMLSNTVLVSQAVGITVTHGNTATLEATLWGSGPWADVVDWGGDGVILTGTINIRGDPAFVDPDHGDYHLGLGSAALDAGVDAGVSDDIDGDPRPVAAGYDIGADEAVPQLTVTKRATPDPVPTGAQLTYTLRLTNSGAIAFTATVTDILPPHVTPTGTLTWTVLALSPGSTWTQTVVVTVEAGYTGALTNVVQAATEEGARGAYTATTAALCIPPAEVHTVGPPTAFPGLPLVLTATVAPPTATLPLTYTWRATGQAPLTHTGGLSDTATFTWTVDGPQVITVTAANACGLVSATQRITVETPCAPPTAAVVSGPPTATLGAPTALTVTIAPPTATLPFTYTWQATGQAPFTHTGGLSDTAVFSWLVGGPQLVTVTVWNACGTAQAVQPVEAAPGVAALIPPAGGQLAYTDPQGLTTTLTFPAGAVTQTTLLVYTPLPAPIHPLPSQLRFAGHAFTLEAARGGSPLSGLSFAQPVTITLHYSDQDIAAIPERGLILTYWDTASGRWLDVINTCSPPSTYDRHHDENWLAVPICHLSEFALLGQSAQRLYLPLILRRW